MKKIVLIFLIFFLNTKYVFANKTNKALKTKYNNKIFIYRPSGAKELINMDIEIYKENRYFLSEKSYFLINGMPGKYYVYENKINPYHILIHNHTKYPKKLSSSYKKLFDFTLKENQEVYIQTHPYYKEYIYNKFTILGPFLYKKLYPKASIKKKERAIKKMEKLRYVERKNTTLN